MKYQEDQMPILKAENPTFKRSQLLDILHRNVRIIFRKIVIKKFCSGRKLQKILLIKSILNLMKRSSYLQLIGGGLYY